MVWEGRGVREGPKALVLRPSGLRATHLVCRPWPVLWAEIGNGHQPSACWVPGFMLGAPPLTLTSFKSHDNSVRDSPPSTPLSIDEGQVQRVTVISSRTRAQVGLLTEPRASLLHRCLSRSEMVFVFGNQRGIFGITPSEYKQFFKIQLIDLEFMLHVVD